MTNPLSKLERIANKAGVIGVGVLTSIVAYFPVKEKYLNLTKNPLNSYALLPNAAAVLTSLAIGVGLAYALKWKLDQEGEQ